MKKLSSYTIFNLFFVVQFILSIVFVHQPYIIYYLSTITFCFLFITRDKYEYPLNYFWILWLLPILLWLIYFIR
jgi:hypothetical protein